MPQDDAAQKTSATLASGTRVWSISMEGPSARDLRARRLRVCPGLGLSGSWHGCVWSKFGRVPRLKEAFSAAVGPGSCRVAGHAAR